MSPYFPIKVTGSLRGLFLHDLRLLLLNHGDNRAARLLNTFWLRPPLVITPALNPWQTLEYISSRYQPPGSSFEMVYGNERIRTQLLSLQRHPCTQLRSSSISGLWDEDSH